MLKLAKYIKKYTGVILLIIVLLVIQANCDLSLPTYTSNIVNVGIQQSGIEDAVADTISSDSMERLFLFMDQEDQELVKANYTEENGIWSLNKISTEDERRAESGSREAHAGGLRFDFRFLRAWSWRRRGHAVSGRKRSL